ncbi:DUF3072 domain-containing protein [Micromonospora sp. NPDC050200]|uniref:DUF3072 domain-containing protein n=1 Tax=Micromonospora sp. NPDC050200 TaxID=3155664 RepID=UPI0033D4AAAC
MITRTWQQAAWSRTRTRWAREAGAEVPDDLTKAEASRRIDELQEETGRGR